MTNTERVALLPSYRVDGSIYEGMAASVALEDGEGFDGYRTIAHCPQYGDALEIAEALNTRSIPNVDELVRAAYLEGHHRGRCDPSLTIWHSADEDWETSKIRAALNQEKDASND